MIPTILDLQKKIEAQDQIIRDLLLFKDQININKYPTKTYFKNLIAYDKESLIGFYGKDPVKQQTATDLATLITAMKAYGLIA